MAKEKNWKKLKKQSVTDSLKNRDVYDTQQLDRTKVGYKQSFISRHIITIAVSLFLMFLIWVIWSFVDINKLDNQSLEEAKMAVVITEQAAAEPRDLADVTWANMILVPDNTYSNFGYTYRDKRTDAKYTNAEYDIWLDIQRKINSGMMPEILRRANEDGTYTFKERDPVAPAPEEPRRWSDAHCINMMQAGVVEDARYKDLGYAYYDKFYKMPITKEEYQIVKTYDKETTQALIDAHKVIFRKKEYTENNVTKTIYVFKDVTKDEVVPIIPTEQAGDRYSTPIALDNLTWVNMQLVKESSASSLGFTYADLRTGLFYTEVEYEHWKNIYENAKKGTNGYTFWMVKSETDDGYVFSDAPEPAGSEPRESFKKLLIPDLMLMNLVKHDFWSRYGYNYYDKYTGMFYSDSEYQIWLDVQNKVASDELSVPMLTQEKIRADKIPATEIIINSLDPLPVKHSFNDGFKYFYFLKVVVCFAVGLLTYALLKSLLKKNLDAQNLMNDTSDINQYENDQHIALPEEIQLKFDWFPDAGAHCPVQVSSMISHMMISNKGLNKIKFAKRAEKDIIDADGNIEYYKGEILLDKDGNEITELVPMIDTDFAADLYEASGAPKEVRKTYDPTKIAYNPDGKDRTKMAGTHKTVAEMINKTWKLPLYEPQRPAGAYIVDTEPVNTMV